MLLLWEKMLSESDEIDEEDEELDENNDDYFGFRKMKKANEEKRKEIERINQTKVDIGKTILIRESTMAKDRERQLWLLLQKIHQRIVLMVVYLSKKF